ncbi:MAG: hypothetical protein ACREUU_09890 [Gammaproteobacteria bacterium]
MPLAFTLDTNCIIAVDESRSEAAFIRELVQAHKAGVAAVGLVAISASERQQAGGHIENFSEFKERVAKLGLGDLDLLEPMLYWDVTFWDFCLWCDEPMEELERGIHEVLFPGIPFLWVDYCAANGLDPKADHPDRKWRNAKCDVQAFWSHAYRKRDVFVTSDRNFHTNSRKSSLIALAGGRIETPESAVTLLRSSTAGA